MTAAISSILADRELAHQLITKGLQTIRERHTCAHRVQELLTIVNSLRMAPTAVQPQPFVREQLTVMS
jgi:spore maturation protein CgeB